MHTNKARRPIEQPSVTVDVIVFTVSGKELQVLLVKRSAEPFVGMWSIPGGFIRRDESPEEAASRVLAEKAGVSEVYLEQLYTFGDPERDPRARVVTVAYFALVPDQELKQSLSWFPVKKLPQLAFDHKKIIQYALSRLKAKIGYSNIAMGLLPAKFSLANLQEIYEVILDKKLDKRNFRKKMLSLGLLEGTGQKEKDGAHRPAMLYRFKSREVVFFDQ